MMAAGPIFFSAESLAASSPLGVRVDMPTLWLCLGTRGELLFATRLNPTLSRFQPDKQCTRHGHNICVSVLLPLEKSVL